MSSTSTSTSTSSSTSTSTSTSSSTSTSPSTSSRTSTSLACCGSPTHNVRPIQLSFTTGFGTGNCGTAVDSNGVTLVNLACGGYYTGGGSNSYPLPFTVPDMGNSLTKV